MKTLYLIRRIADREAFLMMSQGQHHQLTCVFIQDGCWNREPPPVASCYALKEDVEARGIDSPFPLVDYPGLLELIFEHEAVATW